MAIFIGFLIFCQALGAFVGAFTAVWSEIAYLRAMRDGRVSHAEKEHLKIIGHGLRFGMSLLLLASLGLVVVAYVLDVVPQPALTAGYWVFASLALIILGASWALSRRRISSAFGSALAFTAWWILFLLAFQQLPLASFGAAAALFVVSAAIFYGVFTVHRLLLTSR